MPDSARSQAGRAGYVLGIDLGTTYSAAAIARGSFVETVSLGTNAAQIPSVIVHRADAEVLTGEAAERRAPSEPARAAREFKRRLGDPVPIILGGTPYGAEALMAELLAAIVRQVSDREGEAPTQIVLTHPANYSEYKRGLLREAARLAGLDLDRVKLVTEPEAAAIAYAHQQRIDPGEIIAVYDFGGGTFDAAVVRQTPAGFELVGTPEGMERLGGIDFDQAVLAHVDGALDGLVSAADGTDDEVLAGQARLRDDCRHAKEALSADTDAAIPVSIPGVQTSVRLTRDELEQMVRPHVTETVAALHRTIASAGLKPEDVSRVLLVGGSSRMPIVAQVVREATGRPVSIDVDPKLVIASGAALFGSESLPTIREQPDTGPAAPTVPPTVRLPGHTDARGRRAIRRGKIGVAAAAAAAAAAAIAAGVVLARGDGHPSVASPARVTTAVPAVAPAATAPPPPSGRDTAADTASLPVPTRAVDPRPANTIERLAFTGHPGPSGIPGPTVDAGSPGTVVGLAVTPDGRVRVLAGERSLLTVSGGKVALDAELTASDNPAGGLATGSDGTVFVATASGIVRVKDGIRTLALDGAAAGLTGRLGPVALDGGGNLYVADNGRPRIIRLAPDGGLTLVAGTGTLAIPGAAPAPGAVATTSPIGLITGLAVDRDGNLLLADATLHLVHAVAPDGSLATVAGGGTVDAGAIQSSGSADRMRATEVKFASVGSIAVDRYGRVYVADPIGRAVLRVGRDGSTELLLYTGAGATPKYAPSNDQGPLGGVTAVAVTPTDGLLFSDGLALWQVAGAARPG